MTHRPWLAHYDPWVPATLEYPDGPLTDILDTTAAAVPGRIALQFAGAAITYADLKAQADRCAVAFARLGVRKGDRIGLMLPNCPQYVLAAFAALRLGAVIVNINPSFTARELDVVLADATPHLLITLDTLIPVVRATAHWTALARVLVTALGECAEPAAAPPVVDGTLSLMTLIAFAGGGSQTDSPATPVTGADLAVLQYTGGTTGTPKAAMLTHANIFANVVQSTAFMYGTPERGKDRYLLVIPLFHIYGFTVGLLRSINVGATIMLLPKYAPAAMLQAIRDFVPGCVPAVPTIYVSLLAHPDLAASRLDRVRSFHTGGAPCPVDLIERFEAATGRQLNEGYGMSECAPVICTTPLQGLRLPGTVGVPLPDTDIRIVDLDTGDHVLPAGEAGELCVCGPQVMQGYWQRPDESARALRTDADGRRWLYTGDIARLDANGFVTLVQRKKDVIIVDAFKVYPTEVEAVLHTHPAVQMAAVVGVPDGYHGEAVHASVVLRPEWRTRNRSRAGDDDEGPGRDSDDTRAAAHTVEDLLAHCRTQLAPYKVPAFISIREQLPMSAVGKILYRVLREEAVASAAGEERVTWPDALRQ